MEKVELATVLHGADTFEQFLFPCK